jgi:hypothetical protein
VLLLVGIAILVPVFLPKREEEEKSEVEPLV